MAGPALIVSIVGDARKLNSALGDSEKRVGAFGKSIDLGMATKLAGVAGVAIIAGDALLTMGKAAGEDRREAQALDAAIRAAGAATGDYTAQVERAIVAGQDRAFTDTQSREALTSLITATGDVTAATTLLSTAQDIARFANVDLATAADAVAKAQAGQDTALTRMLPGLAKGATAQDTLANASKAAAGQADVFANSTEGGMARSADAFAELGETVGEVVLPILDELLPALVPIIRALGEIVKAILPVAIPLFKLLAKAIGLVAKAVAIVAGALAGFIRQVVDAIGKVGQLLEVLPDLPDLGNLFAAGPTLATAGGAATRGGTPSTRAATGSGGITVNIHGGDPTRVEAAVAKALRNYTRRNGALGLAGMVGRGGIVDSGGTTRAPRPTLLPNAPRHLHPDPQR